MLLLWLALVYYLYRHLETVKVKGKNKAAALYVDRCRLYLSKGIDPDWDGAEKLDFK